MCAGRSCDVLGPASIGQAKGRPDKKARASRCPFTLEEHRTSARCMRRVVGSVCPEQHGPPCAVFDNEAVAARYTAVNSSVQTELAARCLTLLGRLDTGAVVLDIGSGTGLSTAVLRDASFACVGLDISRTSLQMCAQHGDAVLSDVASVGGLPLRRGSCDGAISVSALQWLVANQAQAPAERFFASLRAVLRPVSSSRAVLQVYTRTHEETSRLVAAARGAGVACHAVVDFPHDSVAVKLFLCCGISDAAPDMPACALAWPRRACCAATWVDHSPHIASSAEDAVLLRSRHEAEHAKHWRRLLRLLRRGRGTVVPDGAPGAPPWPAVDQGAWCARTPVASLTVPDADAVDDLYVRATARALRAASWDVDVKPDFSPLPPRVEASRPPGSPAPDPNSLQRRTPRAVRRAALRAAAGGPFHVCVLHVEAAVVTDTFMAGVLLIPDAYAHGVVRMTLHGGHEASSVSQQALEAAECLARLGHSIAALELCCPADSRGAWTLWLLTGGPWRREDARRVAQALAKCPSDVN